MKNSILIFFLCLGSVVWSQEKEDPIHRYGERIVLYSDIGFASAPFSLNYPFSSETKKLPFKNNYSPSLGFGFAHQWLSLYFSFSLKGTQRVVSRYGQTKAFNFGGNYQYQNILFEGGFQHYTGYAIKNAYTWNDTLNELKRNDLRPKTRTYNFTLSAAYFFKKDFKYVAMNGITAEYTRNYGTFFMKPMLSVYGISNENQTIVPTELVDSTNSRTAGLSYRTVDIGIIPGYAYIHKIENWQLGGMFGIGGFLQAKSYELPNNSRGFLGLSPRTDFRFMVGYTQPKYFVFLNANFENKSLRFNKFVYKQTYYSLRLTIGYRFNQRIDKLEDIKPKSRKERRNRD